jgi:hypothetical protein
MVGRIIDGWVAIFGSDAHANVTHADVRKEIRLCQSGSLKKMAGRNIAAANLIPRAPPKNTPPRTTNLPLITV